MTKRRSQPALQDESRLVARMLEGDGAAFLSFFNTYYPRLASFVASRFSVDPASIDDVVQATLIRAIRGLAGYRSDSSLFTWLCTICWHELVTLVRKEEKHQGVESLESLPESQLVELRAPEQCEPECASEAESLRSAISRTLGALPEHYARALQMKYVEGRAVDELAEALGVTTIGAQSLLGRARAAFRLASALET